MRNLSWVGLLGAALVIVSCFLPWISITSRDIIVSGNDGGATNYGKPGYFHLLLAVLFIIFSMIKRVWAKRLNLLVTAFNLAWCIRNFFFLSACSGGECPVRLVGIWLMLAGSIFMLLGALFPNMKASRTETVAS